MKILTKEEEAAHYRSVVQGGSFGTVIGLVGGVAGVMAASRRFHTIRNLTLPMKAFLVTSSGTFLGIIAADHASRQFEADRNENLKYLENREERLRHEELAHMTFSDRVGAWAREEKYKIIGASWVASLIGSFALVGRNPYLSGAQKIVQARVYAQGLTLAVMCATAAFEIHDQRKGQGIVDAAKKGREAAKKEQPENHHVRRDDTADLWRDMVAAEEEKLKKGHKPLFEHELKEHNSPTAAIREKQEHQNESKESKKPVTKTRKSETVKKSEDEKIEVNEDKPEEKSEEEEAKEEEKKSDSE
ncbi:uncharacterized protein TRUGW13939_11308 [Talaromyces rugulosus]|uniref:HIG1 domain-containing protein n=1 Tax=Talaromyces rugulosus TaxID=121627 RepID=A0A7H8RF16_TALRU|nr:uncharacterized protein TRUGW13939_11308 [Talaromyces rugulosus]QKX64135.1 hypothetical protein TRUGW13939_11308 [Talaromyces rugulosus]